MCREGKAGGVEETCGIMTVLRACQDDGALGQFQHIFLMHLNTDVAN